MLITIPTVDPALLIEAHKAVVARKGKVDVAVTMIAHFDNRVPADELIAIHQRMIALSKFILDKDSSSWVMDVKGKRYKLVHEAMFRAAAITLLTIEEDEPIGKASTASTFIRTIANHLHR